MSLVASTLPRFGGEYFGFLFPVPLHAKQVSHLPLSNWKMPEPKQREQLPAPCGGVGGVRGARGGCCGGGGGAGRGGVGAVGPPCTSEGPLRRGRGRSPKGSPMTVILPRRMSSQPPNLSASLFARQRNRRASASLSLVDILMSLMRSSSDGFGTSGGVSVMGASIVGSIQAVPYRNARIVSCSIRRRTAEMCSAAAESIAEGFVVFVDDADVLFTDHNRSCEDKTSMGFCGMGIGCLDLRYTRTGGAAAPVLMACAHNCS